MKQLTDSERLEVAMSLLDEQQVDEYAERCAELEQDCGRNGFHDTPAECENCECSECGLTDAYKHGIGCPYMDC